jgi:hypothetical protein
MSALVGLVVTVILAGAFGAMPYQAGIVIETLFWMAAASGWNILGGFSGLSGGVHTLLYGVLLVGLVMFLPHGVLGGIVALVKLRVKPKAVFGGSAGS